MKLNSYFEFVGHGFDPETGKAGFHYSLQPPGKQLYNFTETLIFPNIANFFTQRSPSVSRGRSWAKIPNILFKNALDNLLLILGISYYKTYCPKEIRLKSISLTKEQANFWNTVYTKGLGEFFYKNKIDFRELINFPYLDNVSPTPTNLPRIEGSLLPLGGGKDSIVSGELLKSHHQNLTAFTIGSHPIKEGVAKLLGVELVTIRRELDNQLIKLNNKSYVYNGHIPISVIYHFVGLLFALLYDYRYVIFSNERSADFGSVNYLGKVVNHQWGKSLEFESLFQNYTADYLTPDIKVFSLLRPLSEIKIVEIFSKYEQYFPVFSSCNKNFKQKSSSELTKNSKDSVWLAKRSSPEASEVWCNQCPKCVFMFTLLAAFLPKEKVIKIFGQNLFANVSLWETFRELLGFKSIKPFDCVGTPEESQLALYKINKKGEFAKDVLMQRYVTEVLPHLGDDGTTKSMPKMEKNLLSPSPDHLIPKEFQNIIEGLV